MDSFAAQKLGAFHRLTVWPLIGFLVTTIGCTGSSNVPAAGMVLFVDQSPVRSGKVELRSPDSPLRAIGVIDAEGKFALQTDDGVEGVPPGQYEAVVVQFIVTEEMSASMHGHGNTVPRRYADYYTSGLTVSIPDEGSEAIQIIVEPE